MKDTFGKAVIATKNINQLRTTLSKSVKVNKDQDRGRELCHFRHCEEIMK